MTPQLALAFIEQHGVVLESARGPVPSLAAAIVGARIHGSWWSHKKSRKIYQLTRHARASPDVLVCRLIDSKITFVHKRLWPALLRLTYEIDPSRTNAIQEAHSNNGRHKVKETSIHCWVPKELKAASERLSRENAIAAISRDVFRSATV